ncbi:hypothetical protein M5689_024849 [Euphorbia peplus]|nr:hypothetical protein M5689_024849 [Euphorbia peplus]
MKEIETLCRNLKIANAEEIVVEVDDDTSSLDQSLNKKVVGRFLMSKPVNLKSMANAFTSICKTHKGFKASKCDRGLFMIEFQSERDKCRVLEEGPWYYDRHLVILTDVIGYDDVAEINMNPSPFWVQIRGIPLSCRNKAMVSK